MCRQKFNKVSAFADALGFNLTTFSKRTGINPGTLSPIWHGGVEKKGKWSPYIPGVDKAVIICKALREENEKQKVFLEETFTVESVFPLVEVKNDGAGNQAS